MPLFTHSSWPRPCFVCGKAIGTSISYGLCSTPRAAVIWRSSGNDGSTVYDSFGRSSIEMVICDDCMNARRDRVIETAVHEKKREVRSWRPWTADERGEWKVDEGGASNSAAVREIDKYKTDGWGATDSILEDGRRVYHMGANLALGNGEKVRVSAQGESWSEAIEQFRAKIAHLAVVPNDEPRYQD
jgi:hypothetical protein